MCGNNSEPTISIKYTLDQYNKDAERMKRHNKELFETIKKNHEEGIDILREHLGLPKDENNNLKMIG